MPASAAIVSTATGLGKAFHAVTASNRKLEPQAFGMKWGYQLPDGKLIFNARSETAAQKVMFADGMRQRRCLIPADSYYE